MVLRADPGLGLDVKVSEVGSTCPGTEVMDTLTHYHMSDDECENTCLALCVQNTGSGRSNACLSVVGRAIMWV